MGDEFDGIFDMDELEDESPFDNMDDDGFLDFDDQGGDDEGISRTFVIAALLITIAVVVVIVLLLLVALSGDDGPTSREQTATAIVIANNNTATAYYATDEALNIIATATRRYELTADASATNAVYAAQTQAALDASATAAAQTAAAITQTAEFHASQTAAAQLAETEAANMTATQTELDRVAEARRLIVKVENRDGQVLSNVRIRLYLDDGDGEFDPEDRLITEPTPIPEPTGDTPAATPTPQPGATRPPAEPGEDVLTYGSAGEGTLGVGEKAVWVFEGSAGDEVSISAEAFDNTQMDTYLEVYDPNGARLATNDDGGDGANALIEALELPVDGVYTIEVNSLNGEGDYTLRLFLTIVPPADGTDEGETGDAGTDEDTVPPTPETSSSYHRPSRTDGIVLVSGGWQGGATPTPEGDTLQDTLLSTVQGMVDFGSLEPGTYWLEIEYDSLPASLQQFYSPNDPLYVQVIVPEEGEVGEVTFQLPPPGTTPTPIPSKTPTPAPTDTPRPDATTPTQDIVTPTTTEETTGTISSPPILNVTGTLEQAGFFGDVGDSAGGIEGTSGLTVLIIAAAGLIAVVFIARKLRST